DGIRDFHVTGVQTCALPISILATQSVTLSPGFSANGVDGTFVARTDVAEGTDDGATLSDYLTRTDYKYDTLTKANKVFINVPNEIGRASCRGRMDARRHIGA